MSQLSVRAARVSTDEGTAWRSMVSEYCCDEMNEAWDDGLVGFGEHEGDTADPAINLYRCDVWPEGTIWTEYSIRFCPFCGTEILLETAEAV